MGEGQRLREKESRGKELEEGRGERGEPCLGSWELGGEALLGEGTVERYSTLVFFFLLCPWGWCVVIRVICFFHSDCQSGHPPAAGAESDPYLG